MYVCVSMCVRENVCVCERMYVCVRENVCACARLRDWPIGLTNARW